MGIVEDELGRGGVFADRAKLSYDYVPTSLPHRDAELRALTGLFRAVADQSVSQTAFVTGNVGTGKTALTKRFVGDFKDACAKHQQSVEYVHVNCRKNASEGLVLHAILKHFDPKYPERGFSTNEMLRDLRKQTEKRNCHLIVVLDEVDALIAKEGSDLVYSFTRFDDERQTPKATLSLVLVSQHAHALMDLDDATRSSFRQSNSFPLKAYDADQLYDILMERVPLAFHRNVVPDEVVELIADIAGVDGDARYAIELLDHAGGTADKEGSVSVEAEHVRDAKAHTRSFVTLDKIQKLGRQPLLVLKAISRKLSRARGRAYITTGEAEEAYQLACEEHGEKPRAHTQFWKYLLELETAGWIDLRKAPRTGKSGNTQYISLPDIPVKVLLEKLEVALGEEAEKAR